MTTLKKNNWFAMARNGADADVFVYDEIGLWGITAKDFADELKSQGDVSTINLHVNSPGGSVGDGMAIYNLLIQHSAEVITYIDGLALSMGSIVALAGDEINMPSNALFMIHEPWSVTAGNSEELRKEADILDKFGEALTNVYIQKTGMEASDIKQLMQDETWMTAEEAQAWGFIDNITDELKAAARVKSSVAERFNSVPEWVRVYKPSAKADNIGAIKMPEKIESVTADEMQAATDAARVAEKQRQADIRTAFSDINQNGQYDHLIQAAIDNDDPVAEIRTRVEWLKAAGTGSESAAKDVRVEAGEDNRDKFKAGVKAAIQARVGSVKHDSANEYNGYSLVELARASLRNAGINAGGSKMQVVGAAFTHSTSDFTSILADVAHKEMLRGFDEAPETFEAWTNKGNLSDFKQMNRVGTTAMKALREVPEGAEFKHTTFTDYGEAIQLATYGELFGITRQAIINDDLSAFTNIPRKMGRAARRTVGDIAYAALTANGAMKDGVALFHADHSNLNAAAAGITTDSVSAMQTAMALQKGRDTNATALNIRPRYLLCPVALQADAETVRTSTTPITATATKQIQGVRNIVANTYDVISDARLDAVSSVDWYMIADPSMYDTVEVAYLDGNETPFLDQQDGWNVDGTEFKVRIDAAAAPMEFASMRKQAGS